MYPSHLFTLHHRAEQSGTLHSSLGHLVTCFLYTLTRGDIDISFPRLRTFHIFLLSITGTWKVTPFIHSWDTLLPASFHLDEKRYLYIFFCLVYVSFRALYHPLHTLAKQRKSTWQIAKKTWAYTLSSLVLILIEKYDSEKRENWKSTSYFYWRFHDSSLKKYSTNYLNINHIIYSSIYPSNYPSIHLHIHLSILLSFLPYIYLSMYSYIHQFA